MDEDRYPLPQKTAWLLLGAIFLISFSLISIEITFSRFLSVILSYHYVFVVLSLALLGLGAGGVFVHRFGHRIAKGSDPFEGLVLSASLFSLFIPVTILLILQTQHIHTLRDPYSLYGFLLFLPFFFAGIFFAVLYKTFPSISGRTYGVDLLGAAAGSLGAVLALDVFGGLKVHFFLGVLASISGLFLAMSGPRGRRAKIAALFSFAFCSCLWVATLMGVYPPDIRVGENPGKEIHQALSASSFKGKIVRTKWSAFGRTDLVKYEPDPGHMDLYIDGTAGSPMYQFGGDPAHPNPPIEQLKTTFPGFFPFLHLPEGEKKEALIIGPGGGRDILLALMGGVQKITAVEVNRDLVEMVRSFSGYNGGIYNDLPHVKLVIEEGRHFLKRQKEKYDVIMLSLPVTNTSRSLEGFSLTENFLLTRDSVIEYLDHLTDGGSLVVVGHNDAEILKLLSIALSALRFRNVEITKAMDQIYITGSQGTENYLVFVLKKRALGLQESLLRYESMHQLGFDPVSSYFPHIGERGGLNPALVSLSRGRITLAQLEKRVEEKGYDIRPVTDNSPFFYKIERGIPKQVSLIFGASLLFTLIVIGIPFVDRVREGMKTEGHPKRRKPFREIPFKPMVLFILLGVAFMLVEISLIQRFVLFLGPPVLSLAMLLFSLLGGAGTGSLWSSRISRDRIPRGISKTSLSAAGLVLCYTFFLPVVFDQLLGLNLVFRSGVTLLLLAPLGFLMGFPFPLGIRLLKELGREKDIPWMWGVNGVSSVLGSGAAIVTALTLGYTGALLISVCCYFIIFLVYVERMDPRLK